MGRAAIPFRARALRIETWEHGSRAKEFCKRCFHCAGPGLHATLVMLLFRERIPPGWIEKVKSNLPAVLVDHAHLERKAATTSINMEKYPALHPRVQDLNAIAIEELQHFQMVLELSKKRSIPFGPAKPSPWIKGLMPS